MDLQELKNELHNRNITSKITGTHIGRYRKASTFII